MRKLWVLLGAWTILAVAWVVPPIVNRAQGLCPVRPDGVRESAAMPMWARRYGFDCGVCHTTVPSLNRTGYQFRRAGFRMPDEYGQDAKFASLKDIYSTRIREEFQIKQTKQSGTPDVNSSAFAFHELTFYPITGAIGKWWAAESELTFNPDEAVEIENAYIRGTYPKGDWLLTARAGIFHPFEGYGASDRPISNIQPLFRASVAKNGTFDSKIKFWGQDQEGLEAGATYKDTTLSLAVFNGYDAQEGSAALGDDNRRKDLLLFFNQMLGDKAAVSAEYLSGSALFAADGKVPSEAAVDVSAAGVVSGVAENPAAWNNYYTRTALYGNYKVMGDKLDLLAGYGMGQDHYPVTVTDHSGTFNSGGWFAEARSALHKHFTAGLRYDTFRPTTKTSGNDVNALTLTGVVPFEEIKFLVDYQNKVTKSPTAADKTDQTIRLEWMVIF